MDERAVSNEIRHHHTETSEGVRFSVLFTHDLSLISF
jgi:hypothetical protein